MALDTFFQVSLILALTTVIAWVTKVLRQPLLIAYIAAGILSGPFFLHIFSGEQELYDIFSEARTGAASSHQCMCGRALKRHLTIQLNLIYKKMTKSKYSYKWLMTSLKS